MGTNLDSYPFHRLMPYFRTRVRSNLVKNKVNQAGNPTYSGSYEKTIDYKGENYFWQNLRSGVISNSGTGVFYDTGGPLWHESTTVGPPIHVPINLVGGVGGTQKLYGPVFPDWTSHGVAAGLTAKNLKDSSLSEGIPWLELMSLGATGISRSIPDVPEISVFTILGELREGLATIPGKQLIKQVGKRKLDPFDPATLYNLLKGGSSEYINIMFGVLPTLSDVEGMTVAASSDYRALRDKLNSDLNHVYRRRRTVRNDSTTTVTTGRGYPYPAPYSGFVTPGDFKKEVVKTNSAWFSGAFSHSAWTPTVNAQINELLRGIEDYGVLPSVDRMWQLVPYSWLVDWIANTGDVLTNISYLGHGGLRLLYGYVMSETKTSTDYTWTGRLGNRPFTTTMHTESTVQVRWPASPYGFGLKFRSLTPTQTAILAALGITRSKLFKSGRMS